MITLKVTAFEKKVNEQIGECIQYSETQDGVDELKEILTIDHVKRLNEGIRRAEYLRLMCLGKPKSEKSVKKDKAMGMLVMLERLAAKQGTTVEALMESLA